MIDRNLLQQLGWSEDLIDAVNRVAEPLRDTEQNIGKYNIGYATSSFSASDKIFTDHNIAHSTHTLNINQKM